MILGIVGSPRKKRLTDQLVTQALEGAKAAGGETRKVYLIDYEVKSYRENVKCCPDELSDLCEEADAIILGAPVYYGDINGLTKDFMDTVKMRDANGKYALGISIAGGTGKGLCSGIQSIYHFFYHRQIRGIDPTPVSRFNFDTALESLFESGKKLAKLSKEKKPFENLWDRIEYYERLDYMNFTFLDEIMLLAKYLIESSKSPKISEAKREYEAAKALISQGKRIDAVKHAVKAYDLLYF
ncbi:TPA: flavodoxin family protein [Candidatus Bathyarchaeota archaeon]|nr:flavodoxin family protein [Candidatus Bathyarchaeota archaeon]